MAAKTGQQIIGQYLRGTLQLPIVKIDELDKKHFSMHILHIKKNTQKHCEFVLI